MASREQKNKEQFEKIVNEEKRKKRKKIVVLFFKLLFCLVIFVMSLYFYVSYISTKKIIVREKRLINNNIPDSFNGIKIIQFSDLHYGSTINISDVHKMVKEINKRNPDLVVFTGDLIDEKYKISNSESENLISELKTIKSTIGKYAISGEDDKDLFSTILNQSDFDILNNEYDLVYNNDNNPILLVGLSSSLKDNRDIDNGFRYFNEENHLANIYTICILHESDDIDNILEQYNVNLFLGGHSHNGQIRIPFIGSLFGVNGSNKYYNEYYKVKNSDIFISGGIGTTGNGIRLFDRPSINFFRISNS